MIDQRQIQKIHDEMVSNPTELLVDAEMRRIRSAVLTTGEGDQEDLITYAKSIVALRFDIAAKSALAIELDGIAEQLNENVGAWCSCSGCHEMNEGHPTGPWSDILKCNLGFGCRECGGIGAVWDSTDYSELSAA